jgi:hypothetical protein
MAAFTETWMKLLDTLLKTFVFIRDVFGYFIPGLSFLALAYYDRLNPLLAGKADTLQILAVVVAAYCLGQILVALGYRLIDTTSFAWTVWRTGSTADQNALARAQKETPTASSAEVAARMKKRTIDATADQLFYRYRFPGIFVERDRQDTIHITRIGLAMALIAASLMHRYGVGPAHKDGATLLWLAAFATGVAILYNSYSNQSHHAVMDKASIAAAKKADDAKMPSPNGQSQSSAA